MPPTVLTIDDEAAVTDMIREHLVNAGFEVLSARSVSEALEVMREREPDVILLDLILPDVHGYNLFDLLRAEGRERPIPVIVVSGCQSGDAQRLAREFGACDYVTKPFLPADLVGRVCRLVQG